MRGLNTGHSTAWSVALMLSSVCEATCPKLSPVTSAPALSRFAKRSATLNMSLRYMITRNEGGTLRAISFW